jgi:uncharacterized protein
MASLAVPEARVRAHHLLCLLAFSGAGYSKAFEKRFSELAGIYRDPSSLLDVADSPDDACEVCPHLSPGDGCVSPEDGPEQSVRNLDRAVLSLLGISPGVHVAGDIHARLAQVTIEDLNRACAGCSWFGKTDCQRLIVEWAVR